MYMFPLLVWLRRYEILQELFAKPDLTDQIKHTKIGKRDLDTEVTLAEMASLLQHLGETNPSRPGGAIVLADMFHKCVVWVIFGVFGLPAGSLPCTALLRCNAGACRELGPGDRCPPCSQRILGAMCTPCPTASLASLHGVQFRQTWMSKSGENPKKRWHFYGPN